MNPAPPVLDHLDQVGPLFEHSPVAMLVFSPDDLQIHRANAAAGALYGRSLDELAGMTMLELRPSEEVPRFLSWVERHRAQIAAGTSHLEGRWEHVRADGRLVTVEVTWTPLVVGGRLMQIAFILDVTARLRAQHERNRSVHRLMVLQEQMHHEIAERLHDGPVQILTAASLRIGLLRRSVEPEVATRLDAIERLVIDALQALRREMDDQRAPADIAADFAGSISSIVSRYGLQDHVTVRAAGGDPPPAIAALLYRVAQRVLSESELDTDVDEPWVIDILVDDASATLRIPVHERTTVEQHLVDWTRPVLGEVHRLVPGGGGAQMLVVTIPIDPAVRGEAEQRHDPEAAT